MTRSRVLDKQRRRVRQACKNCQRRKQKCDGQTPCLHCKKRGDSCSYDPPRTRIPTRKGIMSSPKNSPNLVPPQGRKPGPRYSSPLRSPPGTSFPHHRPCDSPSAMWEWSQPPDTQLGRYEPVAAPGVSNRSGVPVFGSSLISFLTEKSELNSLFSLRHLVDEQIPRRLPDMDGVVGEEPIYVDMGPFGGAAVGYDVPSAGSTDGGVGRCYAAAPDHMDTVPVGTTGIMQLGAWGAHASPSIDLTHCASDTGCYGFAMQQDGYEGNAMQVTQDYTAYQRP